MGTTSQGMPSTTRSWEGREGPPLELMEGGGRADSLTLDFWPSGR